QIADVIEVEDRNAAGRQPLRGSVGTGDRAPNAVTARDQRFDEQIDGGAGADADDRPVLHLIQCGEGRQPLLCITPGRHFHPPDTTVPAIAGTVYEESPGRPLERPSELGLISSLLLSSWPSSLLSPCWHLQLTGLVRCRSI